MAEVTDETVPYEFMIRFNPDGTYIVAYASRRIVKLGDEVLRDEPMQPADVPMPEIEAVVGGMMFSTLQLLEAQSLRIQQLENQVADLTEQVDQLAPAAE